MFDRKEIKFGSISERENKIMIGDLEKIWFGVTPKYKNPDLDKLVGNIIQARDGHHPVILMMGAHPIRCGGQRFINDLIRCGAITHIATNGAAAIHDFEIACYGGTCEDVEYYIKDGRFGNWEETAICINSAVRNGFSQGWGYGESVGYLIFNTPAQYAPFKPFSIFATAYNFDIPITVHVGIGQDITHQHPLADFSAIGGASGIDFLKFAESISGLENGVLMCWGSQVMAPEVYLKALSMARNVARQEGREIKHFTTAVFDQVDLGNYYFRPDKTILKRTASESFYIKDDFRVTIPNLWERILRKSILNKLYPPRRVDL